MKLLNKDTDYVLRALMHLGQVGEEYVSANAIAQAEGIPAYYLKRLLQRLIKEGILIAKEGVRGGVRLAVKPETIRVDHILQLFQGEFQLSECMFRRKLCPNRPTCVLRARLGGIEKKVLGEFEKVTVATLLADLRRKK